MKASSFAQDEKTYSTVEVEFFDKNFHAMIKLDNEFHLEIAAMNYRGLVLASKGPNSREPDEDGYMNE